MDYRARRSSSKSPLRWALYAAIAVVFAAGGYFAHQFMNRSTAVGQEGRKDKNYYVSFDDYYYEIPKQKAVDDRLVLGGQFLYNFGLAVKANTLDDIFNDGAIAVQALIPLNGDKQAFERYLNALKPSAASAFGGTADLTFATRDSDNVRTAELISKKDGKVVRRQFMLNLPQAVAVIANDDSEAFKAIGQSMGQASVKFSDYSQMRLEVLAHSFMLKNQMFDDILRLAHEELRGATSVEELKRLADRNKEIFTLESSVSGVTLRGNEMTATIHFTDPKDPSNTKTVTMVFHHSGGKWQLFTLKMPNGIVTGSTPDSNQ